MNTAIYDISILLIGLVVLIFGGDFLVKGASKIALRFRVSSLFIGLTIVAFGTSAPELLVSLKGALSTASGTHHDLTMGNIIGSNICNLALVLGITAMFTPIKINPNTLKIDWPMAMGSSLLLYLLVSDSRSMLEQHEGGLFLLLLLAYIVFLFSRAKKDRSIAKAATSEVDELDETKVTYLNWAMDFALIIVGCLGLYFGAELFVDGAKGVFHDLGVSDRVIGIMVLAIGTSLPELVTSLVAAFQKNTDLAVGNLMGSNIFNVLSILGITSIIQDIEVSNTIKEYDMLWMLGITLVVLPMMVINRRLGRIQGGILLAIYFYYNYTLFAW